IDAELNIGVISSHMQLSKGILRDAGRLEYHLVQASIRALGQLLNSLLAECVFASAGIRRQRVARLVEPGRCDCEADRWLAFHRERHRRGAACRGRDYGGRGVVLPAPRAAAPTAPAALAVAPDVTRSALGVC